MQAESETQAVEHTVRDALSAAALALSAAHGVEGTPLGTSEPHSEPGAKWVRAEIPFEGPGISGRLLLAATQPNARRLWPLASPLCEREYEDLIGEFSNRLLGSLQRRLLLLLGISVDLGLPTTQRGSLAELFCQTEPVRWEGFSIGEADIFAGLDIRVDADFQRRSVDGDEPPSEGDCIVF